jgi:hypothetical protein
MSWGQVHAPGEIGHRVRGSVMGSVVPWMVCETLSA